MKQNRFNVRLRPFFVFILLTVVANTNRTFSDEGSISRVRTAAINLIEKVNAYAATHPNMPGSITQWQDAAPGTPLLVHSYPSSDAVYYIVPVSDRSGKLTSLIGIDAETFHWQWYGMVTDDTPMPFPRLNEEDAAARSKAYCSEQHLLGDLLRPILTRLPDKHLYWWSALKKRDGRSQALFMPLRGTPRVLDEEELKDVLRPEGIPTPPPMEKKYNPQMRKERAIQPPTAYDIQNVPFSYQETSWYCGEAALQMIFDYYGPSVSQDDIGDVANDDYDYGTYSDDLRRAAHFSSISSAIQNPLLEGYPQRDVGYEGLDMWWSDPQREEHRYEDVKHLISQDYPILVLTWFDGDHGTGHFRVVKGYNDDLDIFIVHDPWEGEPGGPDYYFSQSFFVDDLWPYSYRWGCFVAPWSVDLDAPEQILPNTVFTVSCSITYRGPSPFEDQYFASEVQASLSLPQGYTLEEGTPTLGCPEIGSSGSSGAVSWSVRSPADNSIFDTVAVVAKGLIEGASGSYLDGYADWIGGSALADITTGNNLFYYVGYAIDDDPLGASDGNGDHIADAGETVGITLDIGYIGDQPSTSITAQLSCDQSNPYVTVIDSTGRYGNIEGDTVVTCVDGFVITISQTCVKDTSVLLNLRIIDSEERTLEASCEVHLNAIADILLVCDDGQLSNAPQYIDALNAYGFDFDRWDVPVLDQINERTITRHNTLIWFTGNTEDITLTAADQDLLVNFLTGGGSLFLSGQNIGRDLSLNENGMDFYTGFLHAHFVDDVSEDGFLQGVQGDPITGQFNFVTLGTSQESPDVIEATDGANPIFQYLSSGHGAALKYRDGYHLVYFAFGFEGLRAVSGSSEDLRAAIMNNILNWFDYVPQIGDVNEDGQINIIDVIWTVNIVLGLMTPTASQGWAADFNEDSNVNIIDAILIVNYILGRVR